ncbi:MAG: stability determinant [Rhodoferax sp.]|nr:stability determinant [Rhodoferax sp.]
MTTALSPIVSEFETEEQAASHDKWFRAEVQKALDNTEPRIPHDQVMVEMRELIQSKRDKRGRAG